MSSPEFTRLRDLLKQRLVIIADHEFRDRDPGKHLVALQTISDAITAEHRRIKNILPARLNHFLVQSSLMKALEYIENMEKGIEQ